MLFFRRKPNPDEMPVLPPAVQTPLQTVLAGRPLPSLPRLTPEQAERRRAIGFPVTGQDAAFYRGQVPPDASPAPVPSPFTVIVPAAEPPVNSDPAVLDELRALIKNELDANATLRARRDELENRLRWSHQREEKLAAEIEFLKLDRNAWREAFHRSQTARTAEALFRGEFYAATERFLGAGSRFTRNIRALDFFTSWLFDVFSFRPDVDSDQVPFTSSQALEAFNHSEERCPLPRLKYTLNAAGIARYLSQCAAEYPDELRRARSPKGGRQWVVKNTGLPPF